MSSNNLLILLSGGGDVGRVLTVKAGLRRGRGPERAVRGESRDQRFRSESFSDSVFRLSLSPGAYL